MVDCWMALNVQYTIELTTACLDLNINWWEESCILMTLMASYSSSLPQERYAPFRCHRLLTDLEIPA